MSESSSSATGIENEGVCTLNRVHKLDRSSFARSRPTGTSLGVTADAETMKSIASLARLCGDLRLVPVGDGGRGLV